MKWSTEKSRVPSSHALTILGRSVSHIYIQLDSSRKEQAPNWAPVRSQPFFKTNAAFLLHVLSGPLGAAVTKCAKIFQVGEKISIISRWRTSGEVAIQLNTQLANQLPSPFSVQLTLGLHTRTDLDKVLNEALWAVIVRNEGWKCL